MENKEIAFKKWADQLNIKLGHNPDYKVRVPRKLKKKSIRANGVRLSCYRNKAGTHRKYCYKYERLGKSFAAQFLSDYEKQYKEYKDSLPYVAPEDILRHLGIEPGKDGEMRKSYDI
jgi:hypothetical protein